jgi:hypothetical protein
MPFTQQLNFDYQPQQMPEDNSYQLVNQIFHHLMSKNQGQKAPKKYGYQPQNAYEFKPQNIDFDAEEEAFQRLSPEQKEAYMRRQRMTPSGEEMQTLPWYEPKDIQEWEESERRKGHKVNQIPLDILFSHGRGGAIGGWRVPENIQREEERQRRAGVKNPQIPIEMHEGFEKLSFNPYEGPNNPLMEMLRQRESGGNYGAQNSLGYQGGYQFGAQALEDLGLLKPWTSRMGNAAMNDPNNWTIPGGLDAFLSNPQLQDEAMRAYMEHNRRQLEQTGLINPDTSPEEVNAMLAAAHLGGIGGVKAMMRGQNRRDAYGTGVRDYYNMGLRSV